MCVILFWTSVAVLTYTYVVFPALVFLRGAFFPKPFRSNDITPSVSIIIAAHNEQDSIADKITNLTALDYPESQLEIIIASDGSTDRTDEIVRSFESERVRLLSLPRRGKAAALNDAIPECSGEIVVFSDANSMFARDALRALARPFADDNVGGVAGDQRYIRSTSSSATDGGERSYWGFDRLLKYYESAAGNVISATGAIYAIRRHLFWPVPEGVTDDFATSTAVIAQGYRLVFAHDAVVYEPVAKRSSDEFSRKVRVITRGFRSLLARLELHNPLRFPAYSWQLVSHKWLRRLMIFPLLLLLGTSLILWNRSVFHQAALAAQLAVYGLAVIGSVFGRWSFGRQKSLSIPTYFVMVNIACLVALAKLISGRKVILWEPQRDHSPEMGQRDNNRVSVGRSGGKHAASI